MRRGDVPSVGDPAISLVGDATVNDCRICGRAPWIKRDSRQILTISCNVSDRHSNAVSGWPIDVTVDLWNFWNPRRGP